MERRKGKKRGKDPEYYIDPQEKEDIGWKLELRRSFLKIWGAKKRWRRKTNGNRCEETREAGCDRSSEMMTEIWGKSLVIRKWGKNMRRNMGNGEWKVNIHLYWPDRDEQSSCSPGSQASRTMSQNKEYFPAKQTWKACQHPNSLAIKKLPGLSVCFPTLLLQPCPCSHDWHWICYK